MGRIRNSCQQNSHRQQGGSSRVADLRALSSVRIPSGNRSRVAILHPASLTVLLVLVISFLTAALRTRFYTGRTKKAVAYF